MTVATVSPVVPVVSSPVKVKAPMVAVPAPTKTMMSAAHAAVVRDNAAYFRAERTEREILASVPTVAATGRAWNAMRCAFVTAAIRTGLTQVRVGALLASTNGKARGAQSIANDALAGHALLVHGVTGESFDALHTAIHNGAAKTLRPLIMVEPADFDADALGLAIAESVTAKRASKGPNKVTGPERDAGDESDGNVSGPVVTRATAPELAGAAMTTLAALAPRMSELTTRQRTALCAAMLDAFAAAEAADDAAPAEDDAA